MKLVRKMLLRAINKFMEAQDVRVENLDSHNVV